MHDHPGRFTMEGGMRSRNGSVFVLASLVAWVVAWAWLAAAAVPPTFHVGPGGNDALDGTTYATRWATITKANAAVPSGARVYLWPGTHTGFPAPAAAPVGGQYVTFIGASQSGDAMLDTLVRETVRVPGGSLAKPYVSVKGVTFAGDFGFTETGDRDSASWVTATGSLSNQGGDWGVYNHCRFRGPYLNVNKWTLRSSIGPEISWCEFRALGVGRSGAADHIINVWNADSMRVWFNTFNVRLEQEVTLGHEGEWHFDDRHASYRGNRKAFTIESGDPNRVHFVWRWRSDISVNVGSYGNTFDDERIVVVGGGSARLLPSSSASCGSGDRMAQCVGSWDCTMDSCVVDASGTGGLSQFEFQGGMYGWRLTSTVVAMNGPAVYAFDIHGSEVRSCTLAGVGTVRWADEYSRPLWGAGGMLFSNNVVHAWGGPTMTVAPALAAIPAGYAGSDRNLFWPPPVVRVGASDAGSLAADPLFLGPLKGAFNWRVAPSSPALALGAGAYTVAPVPSPSPSPSPEPTPTPVPCPCDSATVTVTREGAVRVRVGQ